jgi:hypothetical protein
MRDRVPGKCHDFGDNPLCKGEVDERYTMRFDDLGEPPIKWCSHCGPEAQEIQAALDCAFDTRPGFKDEFEREINKYFN